MSYLKNKAIYSLFLFIFLIPTSFAEDIPYILTAAAKGDIDSVQAIIDSGGNPNTLDKDKVTALMYAARKNQVDAIKLLIESGARVNDIDEDGWTALMYAAKKIIPQP